MKAGGIKFADTPSEAKVAASTILGLQIRGQLPQSLLVERKIATVNEYYLGVTYDAIAKSPIILFSDMGGIDIEEVANTYPQHLARTHLSNIEPFSDYKAKEIISSLGLTGSDLMKLTSILVKLVTLFRRYDLTLAEINPLGKLSTGELVSLDCHVDMEDESTSRQLALLNELSIPATEVRQGRPATDFEVRGMEVDSIDPRGVAGRVVEFDGNIGLVIGAGGGSLTLFDAIRNHGGQAANYCEIGGNPSVRKAYELTKLILNKPGVAKIAVMMNVVSNTRVDIMARGVIKAVVDEGHDPAEKIAIFRIPGSWESEGFKILTKYGVDFVDRSVSLDEAALRAVNKVKAK
jgi:succinyl-CoA synthetase beta subunit/citryl-CoA synthetase large subunit